MATIGAGHRHTKLRLKFEVTRQASSPRLCASVRAVPWADEAEQQLSFLAPSSASYLQVFAFFFVAGLTEKTGTDP